MFGGGVLLLLAKPAERMISYMQIRDFFGLASKLRQRRRQNLDTHFVTLQEQERLTGKKGTDRYFTIYQSFGKLKDKMY